MIPKNNAFAIPKLKAKQTSLSNNIQHSKETEDKKINQGIKYNASNFDFPASSGTKRSNQKLSFSANVPPLIVTNKVSCGNNTDGHSKDKKSESEQLSLVYNKSPKKYRSGAPGRSDNYYRLCLLGDETENNYENDVVQLNQDNVTKNFLFHEDYEDNESEVPTHLCDSSNLFHTINNRSSLGMETIAKIRSLSILDPHHDQVSDSADQLSVAYNYNDGDCAFKEDQEYGLLSYDSNISNDVKYADIESSNSLPPPIKKNSVKIVNKIELDDKCESTGALKCNSIFSNISEASGDLLNSSDADTVVKEFVICDSKKGRKIKSIDKSSSRISIRSKFKPFRYRSDRIEEVEAYKWVPVQIESAPFNAVQEVTNSCGPPEISIRKIPDNEFDISFGASQMLQMKTKALSVSKSMKESGKPVAKIVDRNKCIVMNSSDANDPTYQTDRDEEYYSQRLLHFNGVQQSTTLNVFHRKIPQNSSLVLSSSFESSSTKLAGIMINSDLKQNSEILESNWVSMDAIKRSGTESQRCIFLNVGDESTASCFKDIDTLSSNHSAANSIDDSIDTRDNTTIMTTTIEGTKKKPRKNRNEAQSSSTNRRSSARFKSLAPPLSLLTTEDNESNRVEIKLDDNPIKELPCPYLKGILNNYWN